MLHEAQRTSAPSACSVSISTAVWIVMCSDPVMRAPFSGWLFEYSSRIAMRPGISVSAMRISLRPQSASLRSATLKSVKFSGLVRAFMVVPFRQRVTCRGEGVCGSSPVSGSRINERRYRMGPEPGGEGSTAWEGPETLPVAALLGEEAFYPNRAVQLGRILSAPDASLTASFPEDPMDKPLLLGCKGCGNAIVEAAFAVAGIPIDYEEVDYSNDSPTRARLLSVNPLAQVPSLVLPDKRVMTESLAILHYIDDRAPAAKLIPAKGDPAREAFYRWAVFIVAALYPTFTYGDDPKKWVPGEDGAKALKESTNRHRENLWKQLDSVA